jgi:hypothetical protein
MRPLILLIFILALVGCNSKTAIVKSGSVNAQAPFLWETTFPKQMYISDAYSDAAEITKINESMSAWETAMNNTDFFNTAGTDTRDIDAINEATSVLRDSKLSIYKAMVWPYPDYPYALAITQIFAIRYNNGDSDEYVAIQEADIILNYENFEFDTDGFSYDFKTVLVHELGHFLGLQHKPTSYNRNNTVMYPSIYSYEIKQTPLTIDKQDMAEKYGITLPLNAGGSSIVAKPQTYRRAPGDTGQPTKIVLELRANGECVHHADGAVIARHQTR